METNLLRFRAKTENLYIESQENKLSHKIMMLADFTNKMQDSGDIVCLSICRVRRFHWGV